MRNRRTLRCHNPTANPSTSPPFAIPTTHPPGAILRSKIPAERPATLTRMSRERPPELLREKSTEIPAGRARPCRRRIKPEPARRQSRQTEPNGRQRRFQFEPGIERRPGSMGASRPTVTFCGKPRPSNRSPEGSGAATAEIAANRNRDALRPRPAAIQTPHWKKRVAPQRCSTCAPASIRSE
jgi:hypothetical protein